LTLNQLTAHKAINLIKKKKATAYEIMQDIFNQIDKVDNLIKAFLVVEREEALKSSGCRKGYNSYSRNGDYLWL